MTRIHVQYRRRRERYDAAYYRRLHIVVRNTWPERSPYRQSQRWTPTQRRLLWLACLFGVLCLLVLYRAVRALQGG